MQNRFILSAICIVSSVLISSASWAAPGDEVPSPSDPGYEVKTLVDIDPKEFLRELFDGEPPKSRRRELRFFDTANLQLWKKGLVLRLRVEGEDAEFSLKKRPAEDMTSYDAWQIEKSKHFDCEIDGFGKKYTPSCTLQKTLKTKEGKELAELKNNKESSLPWETLSDAQKIFLAGHFGPDLSLTRLSGTSLIKTRTFKWRPTDMDRDLTLEIWEMPDGEFVVEISLRIEADEEPRKAELELVRFLKAHSQKPARRQMSKTESLLRASLPEESRP